MAKKKKTSAPKKTEFKPSPFSPLKGFALSGAEVEKQPETTPDDEPKEEIVSSFADKMAQLGVQRMNSPESEEDILLDEVKFTEVPLPDDSEDETDLFLQAMGELQVNFSDSVPTEDVVPSASARRMKQLKQGKLVPEETLDLHGMTRSDVAEKMLFFLQNAQRQGYQTLLVITGRGLNSVDGEPVLRNETERFLTAEGRKLVAEWGRAPKQYGGEGALILFLRKKIG